MLVERMRGLVQLYGDDGKRLYEFTAGQYRELERHFAVGTKHPWTIEELAADLRAAT